MNDISIKLNVLENKVKSCTLCELHKTRTKTVFSRGNISSKLMFVGEAGGEDEDLLGMPFVGKSGQLLNKAISELGFDSNQDFYICNIIKCRPPDNRKPTEDECNSCFTYLEQQISLVDPKIIIALGSTAMDNLINTTLGITKNRGKIFKAMGRLVIPTYHPSYILRSGGTNSSYYQQFKQDIQLALDHIKEN